MLAYRTRRCYHQYLLEIKKFRNDAKKDSVREIADPGAVIFFSKYTQPPHKLRFFLRLLREAKNLLKLILHRARNEIKVQFMTVDSTTGDIQNMCLFSKQTNSNPADCLCKAALTIL